MPTLKNSSSCALYSTQKSAHFTGEMRTYKVEILTLLGEMDTCRGEMPTLLGEIHTYKGEMLTLLGETHTYKGEMHTPVGEMHTSIRKTGIYDVLVHILCE